MTTTRRRPAHAALPLVVLILAACGVTVPTDPDGTLDTVRGGELRAGVSPHEPWTQIGPDGAPTGLEVDLVEAFARTLDAEVVWTDGGEEELVADMERGDLDLVVGGFSASTPWTSKAAVTVAYVTVTDPDGKPEGHVMLTPMGENAFLVELERFLLEQEVEAP
ncbi:extracellular solute-binding protein family 3 [Cellulomonas flavigena DSM 20109]|uniref:Extracellular solute-binding protein family 3 n=1 Tax=Cellulomonas flavigena (strain ATCC 482 / DSM 20109 / BCRC 11376 / JCM 18109 / NBRC 3775 / NCIMB 8073 / NRS 134) TaxID=446466 RepID=D5UFS8_CELFN|nr:transporter substrate-binding domain-containing protein [Cellulomonas flavigena]ADG73037.1 extracellular solute-binding protein family 3 [Cellulomonas flavigena DSM 20109]